MINDWLRDFRADEGVEAAILRRLEPFLACYGAAASGSEIAGEIGHLAASVWIANSNSQVLLVFGRKEGAWKLPGAHGEGDLLQTAQNEAARALGGARATRSPGLWALGEREIAKYWQTPAHRHFELIFRFEAEFADLPRGARWFSPSEIALLRDATLARLLQKEAALIG